MKLLFENWRGYLKEIGDASLAPYSFKFDSQTTDIGSRSDEEVKYKFSTEKYDYLVLFYGEGLEEEGGWWDISYQDAHTGGVDETGEGNPLRTLTTIVAIVKEFIATPELSKGAKKFQFAGVPKGYGSGEATAGDWKTETRRTKLYLAYLKRNMPPGTKIENDGENKIVFELPADEQEMPQAAE
jgi:hypothetical protein